MNDRELGRALARAATALPVSESESDLRSRTGRFTVSGHNRAEYATEVFAKLFIWLGFIPYEAHHTLMDDTLHYTGVSHRFGVTPEGNTCPLYEIDIRVDDDGVSFQLRGRNDD